MKHWFIRWLESEAAEMLGEAQFYREAIKGETRSARNVLEAYEDDPEELLVTADEYEQVGRLYLEWLRLAEDMIPRGFEKQLIQYYDAKRPLGSIRVLPRLTKLNWTFGDLGEMLEKGLQNSTSLERSSALDKIYDTVCELYSSGLKGKIIEYYERKRAQHPELNLPDPVIHEEFDEETLATGEWKP